MSHGLVVPANDPQKKRPEAVESSGHYASGKVICTNMSTTRKDKKEYGQINPVKSPINKLTVSDNQGYFADYSTNER